MNIQAIKFNLSGAAGCFRKPDVNEKVYFTYNNIHKVALLGLLGAVLGLKGYRNDRLFGEKPAEFPEFYAKLQPLQMSIIPDAERGYFTKKVQCFNNSTGHASHEQGGILQVSEQWLEKPSWTIYLAQGSVAQSLWDKLCDYLRQNKCVYIPYLGKNDFPAVISNVTECELVSQEQSKTTFIHSLFAGTLEELDDFTTIDDRLPYIFSEQAPVGLQTEHNFYVFSQLLFTNCAVRHFTKALFRDHDRMLCFI